MRIERREGQFISAPPERTPCEIFYQSWTSPQARGTLVVTHGISEHSDCYAATAEALVPMGWNVVAWDLRGHGKSEGKRGVIDEFADYSRDLGEFLKFLKTRGALDQPFALVGHSMGGLVVIRYEIEMTAGAPIPNAICLSSPLLGIEVAVPPAKDIAARVLNRLMPSFTMYNEIRFEDLSRDPKVLEAYPKDTLRHSRISPGLYLGMLKTIDEVQAVPDLMKLPILIQAAGHDKVVSLRATREFFPRIAAANKKLIVYEDSYHEIFNDLDRARVFEDLNRFLTETLLQGRSAT